MVSVSMNSARTYTDRNISTIFRSPVCLTESDMPDEADFEEIRIIRRRCEQNHSVFLYSACSHWFHVRFLSKNKAESYPLQVEG